MIKGKYKRKGMYIMSVKEIKSAVMRKKSPPSWGKKPLLMKPCNMPVNAVRLGWSIWWGDSAGT
jgi:hypothetical protein